MRRAAKIDANQNAIVESLREIPGISVAITSALGKGFVDIIVGFECKRRGKINLLIELKDGAKYPSERRLTTDEQKFHDSWKGQIDKAESLDEVLKLIGL